MIASLDNLLDGMLQDRSWHRSDQLVRRAAMLETLERWLVHRGDTLAPALERRIRALMQELEAINHRLYQTIRDDIRRGRGMDSLLPWVDAIAHHGDAESYDPLDTLISGVLDLAEPGEVPGLEAEMVFYQPTPARYIFDFLARAQIDARDTVIDLGAGLGHVVLLTAICTSARCIGIEWQHAYVVSARQCAQALNVRHATFLAQDVRQAQLSDGTVFYLYTPFTGNLLRTVLDMLAREARHRPIRLCSLGPCTDVMAKEPWLSTDNACDPRRVTVFRSR